MMLPGQLMVQVILAQGHFVGKFTHLPDNCPYRIAVLTVAKRVGKKEKGNFVVHVAKQVY